MLGFEIFGTEAKTPPWAANNTATAAAIATVVSERSLLLVS